MSRLSMGLVLTMAAAAAAHALSFGVPVDDAYIFYRYAENLAGGLGPVFNPGERVEGYTSFLWVALLAMAAGLGFSLPATAPVLGAACSALTVGVVYRASRVFGVSGPIALVPAGLVAISTSWGRWAASGMATPLFGLLITCGVLRLIAEAVDPNKRLLGWALMGLATLARPEAAGLFVVTIVALAVLRRGRSRPLALTVAGFGAVVGAHLVFRLAYYGVPLPNTYYAKVSLGWATWQEGVAYLWSFVPSNLWAAWLAIPGLVLARGQQRTLAAALSVVLAAAAAYVVSVGGDYNHYWRFLAPYVPLLATAVGIGTHELWRRTEPRGLGLAGGAVLAIALANAAALGLASDTGDESWAERRAQYDTINHAIEVRGRWLRDHYPPGTTSAAVWLGRLPYYSGLPTIDMLGLTDRVIAHEGIVDTDNPTGHRRQHPTYVLSRQPTLVIVEMFPSKMSDGQLHELVTTRRIYEALDAEHAGPTALPNLIALRDFRLQYAPRLERLPDDTHIVFFERDRTLEDQIAETPAHAAEPKWFFDLGLLYRKHGLLDEAIDAFRQSSQLDPGPAAPRLNLAYLYFDTENYPAALREFEQLNRVSNRLEGIYGLGLTQMKLGQSAEAATTWRRYLSVAPPDARDTHRARALLAEVEGSPR